MSSWGEKLTAEIHDGWVILQSECNSRQITDWGKNKKNLQLFVATFKEIRGRITTQELIERAVYLPSKFTAENTAPLIRQQTTVEKIRNFFAIFNPIKGYFITPILLDLNILIFFFMVANGADPFA